MAWMLSSKLWRVLLATQVEDQAGGAHAADGTGLFQPDDIARAFAGHFGDAGLAPGGDAVLAFEPGQDQAGGLLEELADDGQRRRFLGIQLEVAKGRRGLQRGQDGRQQGSRRQSRKTSLTELAMI